MFEDEVDFYTLKGVIIIATFVIIMSVQYNVGGWAGLLEVRAFICNMLYREMMEGLHMR